MPLKGKIKTVLPFDEPSPNGGAYSRVYVDDEGNEETREFSRTGAVLHRYDGRPRPLSPEGDAQGPPVKAEKKDAK